jgi:SAM-dependent methyltransferase
MEHSIDKSDLVSRFFLKNDILLQKFVYDLPANWWSRPYEYAWAAGFARKEDICLDAASGICHPLKFYLADACNEVYACDTDQRILSPREILKEIEQEFGGDAANKLPQRYLDGIHYTRASITLLPYSGRKFDKVYCISVIEHLNDFFNRHSFIYTFERVAGKYLAHDVYLSLREFRRVLKDDGLIILTFDYPRINLGYFRNIVARLGLRFAGDVSLEIPVNALHSKEHNLYCFRAVLRRCDME